MARVSSRGRASYSGGGFKARRGATAVRFAMYISFTLFVIVPAIIGVSYLTLIASNQYVAEARFSVSGNDIPQIDNIGNLTGLASASIVQDTQIVANYIGSRAAVEVLDKQLNLRKLYADDSIDILSRFPLKRPIEKFVQYWESMHSATISLPSGFVSLKVNAFKPQEALQIANAVLAASETLVNDMNNRVTADTMRTAEIELQRATERLTKARMALESARNSEGFLDAAKAGDALNGLIAESKSSLLVMQQEFATRSKTAAGSPQLAVMRERIEATKKQIADLEGQLTKTRESLSNGLNIAASMSRFAELDLERQIAERLYAGAIASLEVARISSEQKRIYLNAFVRPSLPEEAQYPRRALWSVFLIGGLLTVWGVFWGLLTTIRDHMA
jgi:capsular polysaccharide transport system permease protein